MDEKKAKDSQALFIKLLGLIIVLLGSVSFFVVFFYFPLLSALGFLGTVILSSVGGIFGLFCAKSGFDYAEKFAKNVLASWYELLSIYIISLFCLALSFVCFIRLLGFAFHTFLKMDVRWFEIPQ